MRVALMLELMQFKTSYYLVQNWKLELSPNFLARRGWISSLAFSLANYSSSFSSSSSSLSTDFGTQTSSYWMIEWFRTYLIFNMFFMGPQQVWQSSLCYWLFSFHSRPWTFASLNHWKFSHQQLRMWRMALKEFLALP